MSKVLAGYSSAVDLKHDQGPVFAAFRADYPELAQVASGVYDSDGKCELPPCSLILFWEGDVLKFSLNPKVGSRVCFGGPVDFSQPFETVEQCLREGKFEWKNRKGGNRS